MLDEDILEDANVDTNVVVMRFYGYPVLQQRETWTTRLDNWSSSLLFSIEFVQKYAFIPIPISLQPSRMNGFGMVCDDIHS